MEGMTFEPQDTPRNILIAVDASAYSLEAVRYVGRILSAEAVRITLLHVLNPIPDCLLDSESLPCFRTQIVGSDAWQTQQKQLVQEFMEQAKDLLVGLGHPKAAISVLVEERKQGIARDIANIAQEGFDALVVGRKGMSEVHDLILGSIAHKLVSYLSQTTVWVVGGQPDPARILIAMDCSEGARRALEYLFRVFGREHPDLLLLHVSRGLNLSESGGGGGTLDANWLEQARVELKKAEGRMATVFEDCIGRLETQGADVSRIKTKIVPGVYSRAAAIFGEAQEENCGTIVVGRRGLSRVEEFYIGRVSNKVLQLALDMSVWVVH